MLIIPAIDLLNGKCVRLKQGIEDTQKIYSEHPQEVALKWQQEGARFIHVVNLDGAFGRNNRNVDVIRAILEAVEIPIELGGGIRTLEDAEKWLALGVSRVIFGTIAVTNPEIVSQAVAGFGAERVVVGIDARSDRVAIEGWEKETERDVLSFAREMKSIGVERVIYTDIHRDGGLVGPNVESTLRLARETGLKVIASGGISSIDHLQALAEQGEGLVEGAIIGTALYEGELALSEIIAKFTG